jgi:hypothetical protein
MRCFEQNILPKAWFKSDFYKASFGSWFTNFVCSQVDIALAPWNILAGGKLHTDAEEDDERRLQTGRVSLAV